MDLTTLTPAEIDQLWIEALAPLDRDYVQIASYRSSANRYRKAGGHYLDQADRYAQQAHELQQEVNEKRAALSAPFQAEWDRRGGWTRAYIVPDGHIHRTTACHSLHPTTQIAWLPEQSGKTEDEIIAFAGTVACTICYPDAPVAELLAAEAAKKAETECPGSRKPSDYGSFRRTSYTGSGSAVCQHCGQRIAVRSLGGNLRVHDKPAATPKEATS